MGYDDVCLAIVGLVNLLSLSKTYEFRDDRIVQSNPNPESDELTQDHNRGLQRIISGITQTLERDALVQKTTDAARVALEVDRVVLYYFFRKWEGRVTFESLSSDHFSILGATGPDQCFNGEYAVMYLDGRVRAITDIESEPIADCHREFLKEIQVQANLVVPILTERGLWGLLVAHHCQSVRHWHDADIQLMKAAAQTLSSAPSIKNS